jgi:hypothetical protein
MKRILFTLCLSLLTIISFSQAPTFTFSEEKPDFPPQYIVLKIDSLSINEGYSRTLEWININYNTPNKVIKSQIENKYIRLQGISDKAFTRVSLGITWHKDIRYTIEFKFKENKVRYDVLSYEIWNDGTDYTSAGWTPYPIQYSKLYTKNGKMRKGYGKGVESIMSCFNNIAASLDSYLRNPMSEIITNDDDW